MVRDRRIWAAVVPAAAIAAVLIGNAVSQQRIAGTAPRADELEHAESLSTAFRTAAHKVLPTVVKIKSTINPRQAPARSRNGDNPFRGTPFEDFFSDRFSMPYEPRREGMGSGVIIESDGLVLTNNHVVRGADDVIVQLADGRDFKAAEIRTDPQTDLAIIRIADAGQLPAAQLGDSDRVEIGDWVLAIGNPFELEASVSAGIISAKGRSLRSTERVNYLQTDAAINPGNSGGPLVNLNGEVIGINTAIASSSGGYQGIGFAIPVDVAKWVVEQLVSKGAVTRAWLGVEIMPMGHEMANVLGIDPRTQGVVVRTVNENSPAERAGVRPRDVITHFAGRPVTEPAGLQRAVERVPLGSRQELRVIRDRREVELTVVTEALRDDASGSSRGVEQQGGDVGTDNELGLQVTELTRELSDQLNLPADTKGVVVVNVDPNGLAREGGVERGTVITEVNGVAVESTKDFEDAMEDVEIEQGVTLTVKIPRVGTRFLILKQR